MANFYLLGLRLDLFDGEGAGDAAGAGDGSRGDSQGAVPGNTRRGKSGEYSKVLFGKQDSAAADNPAPTETQQPSDAGKETKDGTGVTSDTLEEKRKAFRALVQGEYKDIYTEETQNIIDRRFRETRNLERQVGEYQPVIDMLMQRYKIADGDTKKLAAAVENDDVYWNEAASEAGLSVEQYKQFQKLQRENARLQQEARARRNSEMADRQLRQWYTEGEALKGKYPSFDLTEESKNPQFLAMLRANVPVEHAYKVIHMDDIVNDAMRTAASDTERRVVDGIRAKGARPAENGTASQSGFTIKDDVSKLTRKDRAEIARRAAQGEIIRF